MTGTLRFPVSNALDNRVLLRVPTKKDEEVTRSLLAKAGVNCVSCTSLPQLIDELQLGVGAILMTEDVIFDRDVELLLAALDKQAAWSDLPIILMARGGLQSNTATRVMAALGNVTLLERPAPMRSVLSIVESAIRARQRQYQSRDQFLAVAQAESRARELQEQWQIAINASDLGTFHCEIPLGRLIWNSRCKEHFWLAPDAHIDLDRFYMIIHPADRERTKVAVEACVFQCKPYDIEYRTVSPEGAIRWVRATGRTFLDPNSNPVRFDGTTQDITARRQKADANQELLESERAARQEAERVSRMKDEFLATLSHELRTPLNAIFGWTQLLKLTKYDPTTLAEGIEIIDRNVRIQTQLIEDLLDMSRIISGKIRLNVQKLDITVVLNAAIEGLRPALQAKMITLEKVFDPGNNLVNGDPGRLQQVIWNLLNNSIKFTAEGGRITIATNQVNSHLEIRISDTGVGIGPDFLPHLFERFSQADGSIKRKHGGLGLGLSIVKNLVELHGGTIRADSPGEQQGATFTIEIPLYSSQQALDDLSPVRASAVEFSGNHEPLTLKGIKVLIVDDEADARELVGRFLMEYDAIPKLSASASDAQKVFASFKPDVIVSDIGMPGQDGYEFMREIRSQGIKTPAIALTAFARAEDRIRSIQAGYQTHLPKPVEPAELLAVIASLSERHQDQLPGT